MRTFISYVPHGVSETNFFPIYEDHEKFQELQEFKKNLLNKKEYDFVLLFNSRNIRRKSIPDTMLAFKLFLDMIPNYASKCCLVLHTQPVDENGTDLYAVRDMLFGEKGEHHVIFSQNRGDSNFMNLLYNSADGVILISSNEGWGLSITEALMCGKPVIGAVTGGIQDQARFSDDDENWVNFSDRFMSNSLAFTNHHGRWFYTVYPSNLSLQGSPLTPYIMDERCSPMEVADVIYQLYKTSPEYRKEYGLLGRQWVTSDESGMSSKNMCDNIMKSIDHVLENWEGREPYEIITIDKSRKKKQVKYPISQ